MTPWKDFIEHRLGFYDVVFVSRPSTFNGVSPKLRELFRKSPLAVVYDCEALWFRRDEAMTRLYKNGIKFPGFEESGTDVTARESKIARRKNSEINLLRLADVVVAVSTNEASIISDLIPGLNMVVIGHIMSSERGAEEPKDNYDRSGILFLASFDGKMYYNGDAIWYFLNQTYPLVIKNASSPIPLTIAGRNIPNYLKKYVEQVKLDEFVTFVESPENIDRLYAAHQIFIAPHIYGSGIQFKVNQV